MQIKEFEAYSLKECLQQVRDALGPEAVILETRKTRKGGVLGVGARDAVRVVAATGVAVKADTGMAKSTPSAARPTHEAARPETQEDNRAAAHIAAVAARAVYARNGQAAEGGKGGKSARSGGGAAVAERPMRDDRPKIEEREAPRPVEAVPSRRSEPAEERKLFSHLSFLERAIQEVRDGLAALKREQQEVHERTVTAVVSAVAPAVTAVSTIAGVASGVAEETRFPELREKLLEAGVIPERADALLDELPDFDGWREEARAPLAETTLRDIITRRVASGGPIRLTPGRLKAVALVGPTGVGKTTTIAKLAAHFSLVEGKKVGLLTVDTYRIAAVEQLKTYGQIIDIPIAVAYNQAEVLPAIEKFADYDLLLIDTAGRSQKNIMQVGELKALLEMVNCETHLVLSAVIKERDMLDAARRFSAARVDRLMFTKLDETSTYGTLFNVADQSGIPLSYLTTGQKVPEDIEIADGATLADLILRQ